MSIVDLRSGLRQARRAVAPDQRSAAADAVAARVATLPWWGDARTVAVSQPFDGELDPMPIAAAARLDGKATFVPVLGDETLGFVEFDDHTVWTPNRYGIAEPVSITEPVDTAVAPTAIDLVIVPAVGVDDAGNRLGMGAGWYDRTFAALEPTTRLVAVVFDVQVVAAIAAEPWDVAMDAIVTPTRVVLTDRRPD